MKEKTHHGEAKRPVTALMKENAHPGETKRPVTTLMNDYPDERKDHPYGRQRPAF